MSQEIAIVRAADVRRLLPMSECIGAMRTALAALARGEAVLPLRPVVHVPDGRGSLYVMPAWIARPDALAVKLITYFPRNQGTAYETHQGVMVLFGDHGEPLAVIEAGSITAIRTAATSAVATDELARRDATELCILGSGVQAKAHLEAMLLVRSIDRVRVWSRSAVHARRLADQACKLYAARIEACATAEEAVRGADVICTVTGATEPILAGQWLKDGAHINAVGASTPLARELDTDSVARAAVYVDSREAALAESGDLLIPMSEGRITDRHIRGELGELLIGSVAGRRRDDEVTLFKSLGLAVEDAAAARLVYERTITSGAALVDFGA
jgi:ornithine cyclodeaminase